MKTSGEIGFLPFEKWKEVEQIDGVGIKNRVYTKPTLYLSLLMHSVN